MLAAVNPCGFALLPAYLSVLVAGDQPRRVRDGSVSGAGSGALSAAGGVVSGSGAVSGGVVSEAGAGALSAAEGGAAGSGLLPAGVLSGARAVASGAVAGGAVAGSRAVSGGIAPSARETLAAVGRALRCTAALTVGYVAVFGVFGLVLAPLTGMLMPRLPWLTVVFGLGLLVLGGWLLAGRSLPTPGKGMRAPRLTGTAASMVLFGMAYAIASLGCAIGPFLAIVVSSLRAGSIVEGVALFISYAAGMGLVIGVTALAVALVRVSAVSRLRRAAAFVPRIGGAVLVIAGAYVAYYGWYELRLAKDLRASGQDPVVNLASNVQRELSSVVSRLGVGWFMLLLAGLILTAFLLSRHRRTSVGS
ncbi:cytochrome C biogenesis protein [Actinoplanes sp. ATCC 53533]|nr:cytochrome C biogenesis protein [Actinoplanes sp. ATCC 53533]